MKSYILRIELEGSEPLIWRRVIMPAGATYNRLHDVIQCVTNFQSGYPHGSYHLYEFDLKKDKRIVTDNEEAYLEHQHYLKNRKYYEERLEAMPEDLLQFEKSYQERLKIQVRKPTGLKIDDYLEKYKEVTYLYDFGDNWTFNIRLEDTVTDYHFGYPTLLDGAETAPLEDVGGLHGYYEFLEAYRNPEHPEHGEKMQWVNGWNYQEYDPQRINSRLRRIEYKKTEWEKIRHENYIIIEDKYRK